MKYYTLAKKLSAELEKQIASPYSINVVEESGRNKIVVMIDERKEENRKRLFEETVQVSLMNSVERLTSMSSVCFVVW